MAKSSNNDDSLFMVGMAFFLVAVLLYAVWHKYHSDIVFYTLKIHWEMLQLIQFDFMPDIIVRWMNELAFYATHHSHTMSFTDLLRVLTNSSYLFVAMPTLLTLWHIIKISKHPANNTKRSITPTRLREITAQHASSVVPLLYYDDLLHSNPTRQKSALSPQEWLEEHALIVNHELDKKAAMRCLTAQLGKRLESLHDMEDHEKLLFSIFALQISDNEGHYGTSQKLLDAANQSCHTGQHEGEAGYPEFDALSHPFETFANEKQWQELFDIHPYSTTLLYTMHQQALQKGKLPSFCFRWLKGMDRTLWYTLNNTGRKVSFVESLAVFTQAHWEQAASEHGFHLNEPHLDDAIEALTNIIHTKYH